MSIIESTIQNAPENNEIKIEGNEKRKVQKGMPKVPMTLLVVGKKGSGKSHAIANLVRKYQSNKKCPAFDPQNVFVLSPTYHLDPTQSLIVADEENIWDTKDGLDEPLLEIQEKIEADLEEFDDWMEKMKAWHLFQVWDSDTGLFPPDLLLKIYDPITESIQKPTNDFPCGKPSSLIFIDDQVGQGGMNASGNSVLSNFSIKHRHYNCSMIYLVQHFTGISRCIRVNSSIIMLFKTHDEKVLDEIAKEVAGEVSKEDFKKLYEFATKKPYNFLLISLNANDDDKFRRNFNKRLTISNINDDGRRDNNENQGV